MFVVALEFVVVLDSVKLSVFGDGLYILGGATEL